VPVEGCLEVMQFVRVSFLTQDRRSVIIRERGIDGLCIIHEIEHEDIMLLRMRPVKTRKRLHRLNSRQRLVHIHRVKKRLVVTGLKFIGANEEAVRVLLNLVHDLAACEPVQRRFGNLFPLVLWFAGKSDDRLIRAFAFQQISLEGMEVLNGPLNTAAHDHRPSLSTNLIQGNNLFMEMVHHDLRFKADRMVVAFDILAKFLASLLRIEFGVAFNRLDQFVVAIHGRVALEHIQDKALVNRLCFIV